MLWIKTILGVTLSIGQTFCFPCIYAYWKPESKILDRKASFSSTFQPFLSILLYVHLIYFFECKDWFVFVSIFRAWRAKSRQNFRNCLHIRSDLQTFSHMLPRFLKLTRDRYFLYLERSYKGFLLLLLHITSRHCEFTATIYNRQTSSSLKGCTACWS